jgi:hypothetical protein
MSNQVTGWSVYLGEKASSLHNMPPANRMRSIADAWKALSPSDKANWGIIASQVPPRPPAEAEEDEEAGEDEDADE